MLLLLFFICVSIAMHRFFYRNVWMPWDDDSEEIDWCKKYLESRIRFCFDLKRNMSRGLAEHIRKLLAEARYIRNKREIMELEMDDDDEVEEGNCFQKTREFNYDERENNHSVF